MHVNLWHVYESQHFIDTFGLQYYETHQGMYGAKSIKPTGLVLPRGSDTIIRSCFRRAGNWTVLRGLSASGTFLTSGSEKYPEALCAELGSLLVNRLSRARQGGYEQPCRPRGRPQHGALCSVGFIDVDPWRRSSSLLWLWPCQGNKVLADITQGGYKISLRNRPLRFA